MFYFYFINTINNIIIYYTILLILISHHTHHIMILKHVHLFGLLLLSLLLASFLGKYINIGEDSAVDGFENTHTGGKLSFSQVDETGNDSSDNVVQPHGAGGGDSLGDGLGDGLGVAFDNILPANIGNTMETFISPIIGNFEGLANDDRGTSSLGISKDTIPPGQGHLYVLKSQVVPPTTCPICPTAGVGGGGSSGGGGNLEDTGSGLSNGLGSAFSSNGGGSSGGSSKCPPCPACARCPEPSFDCKKVPNYSIGQNGAMSVPRPVLADFSQFGM